MQSPHSPEVLDAGDGMCVVECEECRKGRLADIPIGIGLPMFDHFTAEMLAENHRNDRHALATAGRR